MRLRHGFKVKPANQPRVEDILAMLTNLVRVQSLQIEALKRCVGEDRYSAELDKMSKEKPPETEAAPPPEESPILTLDRA